VNILDLSTALPSTVEVYAVSSHLPSERNARNTARLKRQASVQVMVTRTEVPCTSYKVSVSWLRCGIVHILRAASLCRIRNPVDRLAGSGRYHLQPSSRNTARVACYFTVDPVFKSVRSIQRKQYRKYSRTGTYCATARATKYNAKAVYEVQPHACKSRLFCTY
jgi:hypothetical protein